MARSNVEAKRAWAQVMGRYSRAVRVGDIIETTATAAVDPDGQVIGKGDLYEQSRVALQTISDALDQLGSSIKDVVKVRVFLTDLENWEEAGRAHKEFFDEVQPASGFIGVAGFPNPDVLTEIEVTAIVDRD